MNVINLMLLLGIAVCKWALRSVLCLPVGTMELLRAADSDKDQTYFLASVPGTAFWDVKFPLGNLRKGEVRDIAAENGLHVASRRSSTGICFIGRLHFV